MPSTIIYRDRTQYFLQCRRQNPPSRSNGNRNTDDYDSSGLLGNQDGDVEMQRQNEGLPPQWVDVVEEVEYMLSQVQTRMKEVTQLHLKHIENPEFDEHKASAEERDIEAKTRVITTTFQDIQKQIKRIGQVSQNDTSQQQKTVKNVQSSIAVRLQKLSSDFRKSQSIYLKRLKQQQENQDSFNLAGPSNSSAGDDGPVPDEYYDSAATEGQIQQLRDNSEAITKRQEEILNVLQSLNDLHTIFKEISVMVIDQGTLLDQIDYNLEQAHTHVETALKEQEKAQKYQKASGKMICVLLLIVVVITIALIVIFGKWISGGDGGDEAPPEPEPTQTP